MTSNVFGESLNLTQPNSIFQPFRDVRDRHADVFEVGRTIAADAKAATAH